MTEKAREWSAWILGAPAALQCGGVEKAPAHVWDGVFFELRPVGSDSGRNE